MKSKGIITEDMTKRHELCSYMLKQHHILIAGTTGSGKSVMLNSMIYTALREPVDWFFFIDLKKTELLDYKHLYNTFAYCEEPSMVNTVLDAAVKVMEDRFRKMNGAKVYDGNPIYIFIDELADLLTHKGVIDRLEKIGRLGRAAKVHLVCATQDPSRRNLPSTLMKNFTCCLALRCRASIESRQIIGIAGAEALPEYGRGILWDAHGIRTVNIPMTPEADIKKMCAGMSKRAHLLSVLHCLFGNDHYPIDEEYNNRILNNQAAW